MANQEILIICPSPRAIRGLLIARAIKCCVDATSLDQPASLGLDGLTDHGAMTMAVQVDMVMIPGSGGDFGVLPGHVPTVSALKPGVMEIHKTSTDISKVSPHGLCRAIACRQWVTSSSPTTASCPRPRRDHSTRVDAHAIESDGYQLVSLRRLQAHLISWRRQRQACPGPSSIAVQREGNATLTWYTLRRAWACVQYFVSSGFAFVHADSTAEVCAVEAVPLDHLDGAAVKEVRARPLHLSLPTPSLPRCAP